MTGVLGAGPARPRLPRDARAGAAGGRPVRLLILGAGGRGQVYADYARDHPAEARVVGVAEPLPGRRDAFAARHGLAGRHVYPDWETALRDAPPADAVVVATQDRDHLGPVEAAAALGYDILLEKPMAPSPEACRRIVEATRRAGVLLAVCHVLRYTPYTQALKRLLLGGAVGEVVSVQHLEPVGYWHQAHSFVRGLWRNEGESSPMLLAKSCHDLDWLRYVVGRPCREVASFGSLKHFRREEQPPGASDRCLTCPPHVEGSCPYSARRYYLGQLQAGSTGWPVNVITDDLSPEGVVRALESGPYGRCVYGCDNDVVDHQVVNLHFEGGVTATFTMTAFTHARGRETRIFGTRGELFGDSRSLHLHDFLRGETTVIDTETPADGTVLTGHGGGDAGLMRAFLRAVATRDPSQILSGPEETLESHLMVFAAEQARRGGQIVRL